MKLWRCPLEQIRLYLLNRHRIIVPEPFISFSSLSPPLQPDSPEAAILNPQACDTFREGPRKLRLPAAKSSVAAPAEAR
jgi:hypothetical protein